MLLACRGRRIAPLWKASRESFSPPKAVLGVAYEFATGQQLGSGDFEGGKAGAVRVLGELGFGIEKKLKKHKETRK